MNADNLKVHVMAAARDQGISSILFRNAVGRKLGLNVADNECLSFLTISGTATPTALARYTGLTTGSTTVMLDRLEKAGLITRKPNPNDRRGVLVEVSAQWKEISKPLVKDIRQLHEDLIGSYSEEELKTIIDFLTRFTQNVREQTRIIENS